MVRCPKCGKDNPDKQRLCFWCGFDLKEVKAARPETRKPEAPAVKEPRPVVPKEPMMPISESPPTKKNWGSVVGKIAAGIAAVIVFLIIIETIPDLIKITEPSLPYEPPLTTITENNGYYLVHHEWDYGGSRWRYDADVPKTNYEYFKNKPRTSNYSEYVDNPADDNWMNHLGSLLENLAENKGWGDLTL